MINDLGRSVYYTNKREVARTDVSGGRGVVCGGGGGGGGWRGVNVKGLEPK